VEDWLQSGQRAASCASGLGSTLANRITFAMVALIAATYFLALTPGHILAQDDFAAYVMHASNLVEGRPYASIRYIPNPEAPWVSPANGYPPIYPLLLSTVYWSRGVDLWAMKALTVCTFAIFLLVFTFWLRLLVSPILRIPAVLLVGLCPVFWGYRDFISSEFPYLMFSFLALLALRTWPSEFLVRWHLMRAVVLAALLYASYGTRTIGVAIPIAMLLHKLVRRKYPNRFELLVIGLLAMFIVLQAVLITSPMGT
jgi:hypothetical protein